jgi:hypothetical protein
MPPAFLWLEMEKLEFKSWAGACPLPNCKFAKGLSQRHLKENAAIARGIFRSVRPYCL